MYLVYAVLQNCISELRQKLTYSRHTLLRFLPATFEELGAGVHFEDAEVGDPEGEVLRTYLGAVKHFLSQSKKISGRREKRKTVHNVILSILDGICGEMRYRTSELLIILRTLLFV